MAEQMYSIGAVARMAGVSQHTIRKWEDRYQAVAPERTEGGTRRYSRDDIARVSMLRELAEAGHAISAIAGLPAEELERMLREQSGAERASSARQCVAVIGETLPLELKRHAGRMPGLRIAHGAATAGELGAVTADAVVIEVPTLTESSRDELERVRALTGIDKVVVLYAFAAVATAEATSDARTAVMRLPVNYPELQRMVFALADPRQSVYTQGELPGHRFSRGVLARIAGLAPALACECPRHTAELIRSLSEFEDYSAQCETSQPGDAAVHAMLKRTAALARSLFEDALVDLAAHEGIDLDPSEKGPLD